MASKTLQNMIKGKSGLQTTSLEEMSRQQGRPTPTSPLGASNMGANPDQVKMVGSGAQQRNAIRTAMEGSSQPKTLTDRISTSNKTEKSETTEADRLKEGLGGLGGRVQKIAKDRFDAQAAAAVDSATLSVDTGDANLDAALLELQANPSTENLLKVNQLRGIERPMSLEEISGHYNVELGTGPESDLRLSDQEVAGLVGGEVGEVAEGMGYQVLGRLLGEDLGDSPSFTLDEILEKINTKIQDEYTRVESLQTQVADETIGAAERAELRKELREMGASGARVVEDTIDNLWEEIDESNEVEFMGEKIPMGDLLDNDFTTALLARYIEDKESDWAKDFRENYPDLAKFADDNPSILKPMLADVDTVIKDVAAVTEANINSQPKGLSSELMDAFSPEWDSLTGTPVNNPPIVLAMQANSDTIGPITTIMEKFPEYAEELKHYDAAQLRELGIGENNPQKLHSLMTYLEDVQKLQSGTPYHQFIDGSMTEETWRGLSDRAVALQNSGLVGDLDLDILRPNKTNLNSMYLDQNGKPLPLSTLKGKIPNVRTRYAGLKSVTDNPNELFDLVEPYFRNDSVLGRHEVQDLANKVNMDQLDMINNSSLHGKVAPDANYYNVLRDAMKRKVAESGSLDEMIRGQNFGVDSLYGLHYTATHPSTINNPDQFNKMHYNVSHTINIMNDMISQESNGLKRSVLEDERNQLLGVKSRMQAGKADYDEGQKPVDTGRAGFGYNNPYDTGPSGSEEQVIGLLNAPGRLINSKEVRGMKKFGKKVNQAAKDEAKNLSKKINKDPISGAYNRLKASSEVEDIEAALKNPFGG